MADDNVETQGQSTTQGGSSKSATTDTQSNAQVGQNNVAPSSPAPSNQPVSAASETPQQEFDRLAARKMDLWNQIRTKPDGIRENTPEQQEINQIDQRLMEIWETGTVTRKED